MTPTPPHLNGEEADSICAPPALAIGRVPLEIGGKLAVPAVAVVEQLFLVVDQLLARFGRELQSRSFDDCIDRASLLAEAAIDALGHVDVVARGAPAAVLARLGLDGDGLRGADRLAELAGDAALLTVGIAAQRVLAAKTRALRTPLVRIVDRRLGLEHVTQRQRKPGHDFLQQVRARHAIEGRHDVPPAWIGPCRINYTATPVVA